MGWFIVAALFTVSAAVTYSGIQAAKKQARKAADAMAGVLVNKESNIEPIPVIYGERRVGGVRVFVSTRDASGGDKNEYLYIALALAEGEVNSITDIKINDKPITDAKFNGLYSYNVHLGTDDQTYDTLLAEAGSDWTSSHRLRGIAYIAIRLKWDSDAFSGIPEITALVQGRKVYDPRTGATAYSNNPALCIRDYLTNTRYGKGLPESAIDDTAFVSAANDCDESVTFYANGTTGKIFQTNAVLQTDETLFSNIKTMLQGCRGFLPYTQGTYSLKIDKSGSSVYAFDTDTIIGGISIKGEEKKDKFNRFIVKFPNADLDYQPDQAIWPEAGSSEEVAFLAEDNNTLLVQNLELETVTNFYVARDLARVMLKRSRNATRVQFRASSEAIQLTVADIVTITHPTPAWNAKPFQIEEITLNYDGTCNVSAVEYDSSIYTYDLSAEEKTYPDTDLPNPFEVASPTNLAATSTTVVASDGTLLPSLRLTWTESADSFVNQYEVQYQRGSALVDYGQITDAYTTNTDHGLITNAASITLDYGSIDDPVATDEPNYNSVFVTTNQYVITGVIPSANYNIRIRAVNDLGVKSNFITLSGLAEGDTDPCGIPDSLSAVGGLKEISLSWIIPTEPDYSHVEVWENIVNNSATATKIATASGDNFARTGLGYNVLRYYWVKSVDYSGNVSAFSSVASATTLFVDTDSFSQAVNDLFSEAGAYGIEPVSSLPSTGDFNGQIKYQTTQNKLYRWDSATSAWTDDIFSITSGSVDLASFASGIEPISIVSSLPNPSGYTGANLVFLTTDYKLYRYNGTAFVSSVAAGDITGTIGSDVFPNNLRPVEIVSTLPTSGNFQGRQVFLTSDNKLYRYNGTSFIASVATSDLQGQVSSTQISDNSISTAKIQADAITANEIATGAVTADAVTAGSIGAAAIAADAITSDKIAANAVTAGAIQAGAIGATAIASDAITSDKILAGAIQTSDLAANSITGGLIAASGVITSAAQIDDAVITSAKIDNLAVTQGKIANLAVDTIKIADQAVTIPSSVELASTVNISSTTEQLVLTLTFTGTGATADVISTVSAGGAGSSYLQLHYYHNNTLVHSKLYSYGGIVAFPITTTSGTNTIKLYCRLFSSGSVAIVPQAYIRSLETKK